MTFLILRSQYNASTLKELDKLRAHAERLGVAESDIVCPTMTTTRRIGRSRDRIEVQVPVLDSFLFIKWTSGDTHFVNYVEDVFPFISAMRRAQGGFMHCTAKDIESVNKLAAQAPMPDSAPAIAWEAGSECEVEVGFLHGLRGIVQRMTSSGMVRIKIEPTEAIKHGLKLSTLQIHGSALRIPLVSK